MQLAKESKDRKKKTRLPGGSRVTSSCFCLSLPAPFQGFGSVFRKLWEVGVWPDGGKHAYARLCDRIFKPTESVVRARSDSASLLRFLGQTVVGRNVQAFTLA